MPLLLLLLFIFCLVFLSPIKETFEYNPDEGMNAAKASLFLKGFPLYKQIWSDQPPIFTLILANWFKLFGLSVYFGRILVVLFSGLLLWALFQTVRNDWGGMGALCASVFLVFSAGFIRLSSSLMIGLPALSLGMSSIYLIILYKKHNSLGLLALSGLCMALSLQTKFFTAILILPALSIFLQQPNPPEKQKSSSGFIPGFIWLSILSCAYLAVVLIFFYPELHLFRAQLFQPHLNKLSLPRNDFSIINLLLLQDYNVLVLALTGTLACAKQKDWRFLPPFIWLSLAIIVLAKYRPLWDHHYLLISIPLCWLAGISISVFLRGLPFSGWFTRKNFPGLAQILISFLTILGIISCIANLALKSKVAWAEFIPVQKNQGNEMVNTLLKFKNKTRWIITDEPIFAFYADIPVPPEIAVATIKRRFSEGLSQKYFEDIFQKYEPEQVLLGRFQDYPLGVKSYLKNRYSQFSQIEIYQKPLLPDLCRVMIWEPLGKFLLGSIKFTSNKWLYHKIWHSFRLPVFPVIKLPPGKNTNKITLTLFIRNDILKDF